MKNEILVRNIVREEIYKFLSESLNEDVFINEAGIPCTYENVIDGLFARFKDDPKWKDNALTYLDGNYKLKEEQVEKIIDELSKLISFEKNK